MQTELQAGFCTRRNIEFATATSLLVTYAGESKMTAWSTHEVRRTLMDGTIHVHDEEVYRLPIKKRPPRRLWIFYESCSTPNLQIHLLVTEHSGDSTVG